jgi:hypothetical protein
MHKLRSVALIIGVVVSVTACGGSKGTSEADIKADVAAQLADNGLDKVAAECFAGVLVDDMGADKLKDVDFSADTPPAGQEDEFAAAAMKALSTCKIDAGSLGG